MLTGSLPMSDVANEASKLNRFISSLSVKASAAARRERVDITSLAELEAYCQQYNSSLGETYCQDILVITLNDGEMTRFSNSFEGIGSKAAPFDGEIYILQSDTTIGYRFELNRPLFNYVTDAVKINYYVVSESGGTTPIELDLIRNGYSGTPLLADHVVKSSTKSGNVTWKVRAGYYEDADKENTNAYDFAGLFGTIESGAEITVEYDNSATVGDVSASTRSDANAGMICGEMQNNAVVHLTELKGTNTNGNVSTTSGDAGGLVGRMLSGSRLEIGSITPDYNARAISTQNGYAGGLVGYCDGGTVVLPDDYVYTLKSGSTVTGTTASGGLYGYYRNTSAAEFDLTSDYSIDSITVNGSKSGGLFGVLESNANVSVKNGTYSFTSIGTDRIGGVVGEYRTNALTNTFDINSVTVSITKTDVCSNYGGIVGCIDGNTPAYIKADDFTLTAQKASDNSTTFGGITANAGNGGSLLDIGNVTITATGSFNGGGLVGALNKGVLRLHGTTDLSGAAVSSPSSVRGQIVGRRQDALVYALGTGNANDAGWVLKRSVTSVKADDIASWGEVIKNADIEDETNGILAFDKSAHTITVSQAVINMDSAMDVLATALNMQLNNGGLGALQFENTSDSLRTALLANKNLKVTGSISLADTGFTGFMRDDYISSETEIGEFTGKLTGENNAKLTLSIGQAYGVTENNVGNGIINYHRYNGLFAITGTGAELSNITVGGSLSVDSHRDWTGVGAIAAKTNNGITLTDVSTDITINFERSGGQRLYVGGAIGYVGTDNANNISIKKDSSRSELHSSINITGTYADNNYFNAAGGIGGVLSKNTFTIEFENVDLKANISSETGSPNFQTAGLIASIESTYNTYNDTRTVILNGLTVHDTTISNSATLSTGGMLGYSWLNTNVEAKNITLSSNNSISTSATNTAGLVYMATGYWQVPKNGITINALNVANGGSSSFGMLVNTGCEGTSSAIYLEMQDKDSYLLGTGLTVPASTVYDEFVAYTHYHRPDNSSNGDILSNGNGIVSIETDGEFSMDKANCNSYQNKYNTSRSNSHSRYYYNVYSHKTDTTGGWALLNWSLTKYASGNIRHCFSDPFNGGAVTGTFDLMNVPYYPVDINSTAATTLGDIDVTFYNNEIENTEDLGTTKKSTRSGSQQYLMHSGLFRNVTTTLNSNGNIHFKGSIAATKSGSNIAYSGAFINGTLTGKLDTSASKEIVLEGITLSDNSGYLLINGIGSNGSLYLRGVRTGGGQDFSAENKTSETKYTSNNIASSLIGKASGSSIHIEFDKIKLDSRDGGTITNGDAIYGTTASIFSSATLLNQLNIDNNSVAFYNYNEDEDWKDGVHLGHVTYGKEIKTSVEFAEQQEKYYDGAHFTDPQTDPTESVRTEVYPFNSGFKPYVAIITNGQTRYRELKVNVRVDGLTDGCGTYNDPYLITQDDQFVIVARTINASNLPDSLSLPINPVDVTNNDHWCNVNEETGKCDGCTIFTHSGTNYVTAVDDTTYSWTEEQVRLYLAGAYYKVMNDITIDDANYPGLGASSDTTGKYAFRGVIVGAREDGSIKITQNVYGKSIDGNKKTYYSFIAYSNGSVLRDLSFNPIMPTNCYPYYYTTGDYTYTDNAPSYGGIISCIMGGDNIIDNVKVEFTNAIRVSNDAGTLNRASIGGYVGVVVNGGLFFRRMKDNDLTNYHVYKGNNTTADTSQELFDKDWYASPFVNRFVGRVMNGYAVNEVEGRYSYSEDGYYAKSVASNKTSKVRTTNENDIVTLKNGRKGYSIPDIDSSATNKLSFEKTGDVYNILNIPDAQSLYVLSAITKSAVGGASTEKGEYRLTCSFDGQNSYYFSGNTNTGTYKAAHHGEYKNVGNTNDNSDADYQLTLNDKVNSRTVVPYIIRQYTTGYNIGTEEDPDWIYPARTLTQRTFFVNLTGNDLIYHLPDSFSGIGKLYVNGVPKDDSMKVYGFNGNDNTIDVSTYYVHANSDGTLFNGYGNNIRNGIGLFNWLTQSVSGYSSDPAYQIGNFKMTGFIGSDNITYTGAVSYFALSNNNPASYGVSGLIGHVHYGDYTFNISDIDFSDFYVHSSSYAGALIPRINNSGYNTNIYINNVNAANTIVEGHTFSGGFFGSVEINKNSGIFINTKDESTSALKNISIIQLRDNENFANCSTGGLIGYCATGNNAPSDAADRGTVLAQNVTITGGSTDHYIGNKNTPSGDSGGLIGRTGNGYGYLFKDCKVEKINIYGNNAGGIYGNATSDYTRPRIVDCTVMGELDSDGEQVYSIIAKQAAGGIAGRLQKASSTDSFPKLSGKLYSNTVDGAYVSGYIIEQKNENGNNGYASGGIIGVSAGDDEKRICNIKVENVKLICNGKNNNNGMGGVIGWSATAASCSARNLVVAGITFDNNTVHTDHGGTNIAPYGLFIGKTNGCLIKAVGYSRQGTNTNIKPFYNKIPSGSNVEFDVGRLWSDASAAGNSNIRSGDLKDGSYIIYSDFSGNCLTKTDETAKLSGLTTYASGRSAVDRPTAFPFATVSPTTQMGATEYLTGDGAAVYVEGSGEYAVTYPMIRKIASDTTAKKYTVASSTDLSDVLTAANSTSDQANKISTYKTEMGSTPEGVDDFAVIVINTTNQSDSTDLINECIRTLSNTTYDYAATGTTSSQYFISVNPCVFDGTNYVINTSGTAGLKYNGYQFYMESNYADSNQTGNQFSLIDVQYFDPSNTSKVAYHLYIPVLTKKMLNFEFRSASLSGTDAKPDSYTDKFGNTIAESLGSWFTSYVQFRYPADEINAMLAGDKGIEWNHSKAVALNYTTAGSIEGRKLSDDTQLILIDPNNNDNVYYSTMGQMRGDTTAAKSTKLDTLNFSNFYTASRSLTMNGAEQALRLQMSRLSFLICFRVRSKL